MQNSLFSGVREKNKELVNKLKNRKKATKQVSKNKLKAQLNNIEKRVHENFTEEEKQKIEVITDQNKLYKFFTKDELYAVDTESDVVGSNPDPMLDTLVGLSGYSKNNNGIYVPIKHKKTNLITFNYKYDYDKQLTYKQVSEVFREIDKKFIFHNSVYDIRVFINALGQFDKNSTGWETYIASTYLNENEKHSLKYLYDRYVLGKSEQESMSFKDLFKDINISLVPIYLASLYGAKDAIMTYELYEFQREYLHPEGEYIDQTGLKEAGKFYLNWEIPTIKAVINMEERGFDFDSEYANELSKKYTDKINKIEKEIHDFLDSLDYSHLSDKKKSKLGDPINLNSPVQLAIVIYDVLHLEYEERTTAADALKHFRDEAKDENIRLFFDNMLKERKIGKLLSTYIDKLPEVVKSDGKIHTRLNQVGAKTGRFSSSEPNCYDDKTEILTDSGWKLFKNLDKTEKVAQWEENGEIEFVKPLDYISYHFKGDMYKFDYQGVDLLVTPDHRMLSKTRAGRLVTETAEEFYDKFKRLPRTIDRKAIRGGIKKEGRTLTKEEKLSLEKAIAVQADGYVQEGINRIKIEVKSKRKVARLKVLFDNVKRKGQSDKFYINLYKEEDEYLKEWLDLSVDSKTKVFKDREILNLDYEARKWFLECIHRWGGDYTRGATFLQRNDRKRAVDLVQSVALMTGYSTSWYDKDDKHTVVNLYKGTDRYFSTTEINKVPYDGQVYCVTVPSEKIVVRRNNQATVSYNCQNIPSDNHEIRQMFKADEGKVLISTDYSQQEPRILSYVSGDEHMIEAYNNGKDLYAIIASMIFDVPYETCTKEQENEEYRDYCKSLLLGVLYGMGIPTVAEMMGKTPKEAQKILDAFFDRFPKVKDTIEKTRIFCKKNNYVKTIYGRKRRLPDINLPEYEVKCDDPKKRKEYRKKLEKARYWKQKQRIKQQAKQDGVKIKDNTGFIAEAERQTINSVIQGSASDMTKKAIVLIDNDDYLAELGYELLLPVHDEVIGQIENDLEKIEKAKKRVEELMLKAGDPVTVTMSVDHEVSKKWYGELIK
jgi:DNA polymerase I-like protein with 3'-5' exonuclease and polymerase domains